MHQHLVVVAANLPSGVVWAAEFRFSCGGMAWDGTRRPCVLSFGGNPGAKPVTVSSAEVTIRSEQEL